MTLPGGIAFAGGRLMRRAVQTVVLLPTATVQFSPVDRFPRGIPQLALYVAGAAVGGPNRFGFAALSITAGPRPNLCNGYFLFDLLTMNTNQYAVVVENGWQDPPGVGIPVTVDLFHYEVIP